MQSNKYELRRKSIGITVKELYMLFMYGDHTYRLIIKRDDDCVRLILVSDDYEEIESECLDNVGGLSTVMNFLRTALPH